MLGICKVKDLATGKGRMERRVATGTDHGRATFMYVL